MKDCTGATTAKFLFEYVLMRFGYPNILMSDRGTYFLNETISVGRGISGISLEEHTLSPVG